MPLMFSFSRFNFYFRVISRLDPTVSQYLQRRWMHRRELWAACFRDNVLTFGNDTNNRVESSHKQMKRYLQRCDSLHKSMLKVYKWYERSFSRIQQEAVIAQSRCFTYPCAQRVIPIIRLLTPYAARKVIREYQWRRWATVEFESFDYVFFKENGNTVQVDLSACTCTCFTFQTCRYPCRHLLLVHFRK
uniref:SWIM-type domain-containing protein n=1 Tax=Trichobilharzia regenti TaxID=157069 RepID=A0AA85KI94_TRIRE